MYNKKIFQHYVEHEWNQTNSNLTMQGESTRVATNEKELGDLANEVEDLDVDMGDGETLTHGSAKPLETEVGVHVCLKTLLCATGLPN